MKIKRHYLKKTLEWLLPYTCILCKYPASGRRDLCSDCQQTLLLLTHACHRCAIPLSSYQKELLCGSCLQHPPPFDITHALYFYEPPLPKLILSLKFNASLITARILGELLAEKIQETWYKNKALPQWIVPVPLHAARLKERGFNQALEIARPLAKQLLLPINTSSTRYKYTLPQATLSVAERQKNIQTAFAVPEDWTGQHLAVIDDVMTTGYTIKEFCHALKQAGAKRIDVWCIARRALD